MPWGETFDTHSKEVVGSEELSGSLINMSIWQPPKVTVGVATYNAECFIAEAIDSVLAQRFTDLVTIIVDDHSVDSTVETVRRIHDPRMTLYENERRLGIPQNWNRTLSPARGEYV